ncbi:uncharacterized protein [Spinacia oleracea]|uniref:RNase H type-1 domain-containing protein n=1 Tax=Spinacia oleracea TaxID=3562 RepID=A0ABM3QPA4_SPIOL|nr:uncharacterized protein LOC110777006 [Spinacia oleracea]XP_056685190.1 uncharacterized protein LOC110777006 [Spinacia oleracea]XP_056685191.1 uncharacterized protein LOC110777006 [Spinacia oleracea]
MKSPKKPIKILTRPSPSTEEKSTQTPKSPVATYQRRLNPLARPYNRIPVSKALMEIQPSSQITTCLNLFPTVTEKPLCSPKLSTPGSPTELRGALLLLDSMQRKEEEIIRCPLQRRLLIDQQVEKNPLVIPESIPTFHLLLESHGLDMGRKDRLMVMFITRSQVVGVQLQARYTQVLARPKEVHALVTPIRLEDVGPMGMVDCWRDWEEFFLPQEQIPNSPGTVNNLRPLPCLNMKIVMWNVRGASKNDFLPHAWSIIDKQHPTVFVFLETKADDLRARQVMLQLGFHDFKVVQANSRRGGIWVFWKNTVDLVTFSVGDYHFHGLFHFKNVKEEALVTAMHAPSKAMQCHQVWKDMQADLPPATTSWLLVGDLNEVTSHSEKSGGRDFRPSQCRDFNNFRDEAGLVDLGFSGNPFTWENMREGAALIRERLDRALANAKWLDTFPHTKDKGKGKMGEVYTPRPSWTPPAPGFMKLNTDGAWKGIDEAGGGGVLRRENGDWYLGFSSKFNAKTPLAAELLAMREGLAMAKAFQVPKLEVETDAESLIFMLDTSGVNPYPHHELAAVISDVRNQIKEDWVIVFKHVPRHKNVVAHHLAAMAMEMAVGHVTHFEVPPRAFNDFKKDKAAADRFGGGSANA